MASDHGQHAHHLEEFGAAEVKHTDKPESPSTIDQYSPLAATANRLRKRLFQERQLQQHFEGNVLFRTMSSRTVTQDELFLDLIIVANIAAIGHELRESFQGWKEFEKFFLLFGAVYSVWRGLVSFWNLWASTSDYNDKWFVYFVFTMLTFIGVGAHGAFTVARPFVAVGAFLGTAIPWGLSAYFSSREQLLKGKDNVVNNGVLTGVVQTMLAVPYLVACFVQNERAVKILFWIPVISQPVVSILTWKVFRFFHRNRPNRTTHAVNIELMVEKFEVLTLIVLGEALLAILFDAAVYILEPNARVGVMYAAVLGATAIVASFQTIYMNIDNKILRGGKHAIRHNSYAGFLWTFLHFPYHLCLVLFGTALGLLLRDVIITPKPPAATAASVAHFATDVVVRAAKKASSGSPYFGASQRWLFSGGWAGTMLLSGLLSLIHSLGPRDFTRRTRVLLRSIVAIGLGVGMPFTNVSAGVYLSVHTFVTGFFSMVEFILVNMDSVHMFRKLVTKKQNLGDSEDTEIYRDSIDDEDTDEEDDKGDSNENVDGKEAEVPASADPEAQEARVNECGARRKRRARMLSRGRNRLVQISCDNWKKNCADTI